MKAEIKPVMLRQVECGCFIVIFIGFLIDVVQPELPRNEWVNHSIPRHGRYIYLCVFCVFVDGVFYLLFSNCFPVVCGQPNVFPVYELLTSIFMLQTEIVEHLFIYFSID